jgi:two-component system response regulator GlrR
MQYKWPGNVRELSNVMQRAVVLAPDAHITPDLILLGSEPTQNVSPELLSLKEAREDFERAYLVQVLTATKGNVSQAAALSGRYRTDFYKLLRKHALDPRAFKDKRLLS